jgi:Escherichia/Staphylococcus phage prohead protease
MNDLARNTAVKASDIRTVREFEDFLRDVGGYSHAAAKSIARAGFKAGETEPSGLEALLASLRNVRRAM